MNKRDDCGTSKAKTRLSKFFHETGRGRKKMDWQALMASFREIRSRIAKRGKALHVRDLIDEGRRT